MGSDADSLESRAVSSEAHELDAATRKVLAGIDDPELEARYPNRTHFIAAADPRHSIMATRALFAGDPVAIVYADGREVLFTPEQARGPAVLFLYLATIWLRFSSRGSDRTAVQLPPRTRIEARDSAGLPIAA